MSLHPKRHSRDINLLEGKMSFITVLILLSLSCSTFLVIPNIQGTLIPLMLLPIFLLTSSHLNKIGFFRFFSQSFLFLFIYGIYQTLIIFISSNSHPADWMSDSGLILINQLDASLSFKSSTITQSIYLFSGVLFFFLCKNFGNESWTRMAIFGSAFTSLIGIAEVALTFITRTPQQFLYNRFFFNSGDVLNSALTQYFNLGGVSIKRLDGLSLEASMFAIVTIPFLYLAYQRKMTISTYVILLATVLTFSSTAYLGLLGFAYLVLKNQRKGSAIGRVIFYTSSLLAIPLFYSLLNTLFTSLFVNKVEQSNLSGVERSANFLNSFQFYFKDMTIFEKIFGIGFGTIRSTDFISTLFVNSGILGLIIFLFLFLRPVIRSTLRENLPLLLCLVFLTVGMLIAVPEFSFPSIWFVLGLAYREKNKMDKPLIAENLNAQRT